MTNDMTLPLPDGPGENVPPDDAPPTASLGDFDLLEELGRGRLGTVYKARQVSLDRIVAIKIMHVEALSDAETVAAFRRRVDAAAQVDHPGIARTYNWGEHDGRHFIVMAYIPGRTLESLIGEVVLAPRDAVQLVRQAAEALHAAHQKGVLHGSLHPGQIIVGTDSQARVTDLALSPTAPAWTAEARRQPYLSAEQLGLAHPRWKRHGLAAEEVSPRSDVFSLGAILYTLLCGTPPYAASDDPDALAAARVGLPASPARLNPQIDAGLEWICYRSLRFQAAAQGRYDTAIELMADLLRWLNGRPLKQQRLGVRERLKLWVQQTVHSFSLLLVVLLLGVLPLSWGLFKGLIERRLADQVLPRADAATVDYQSALASVKDRLRWHPHQRNLQVQHGLALFRLRRFGEAKQAVWEGWMPPRMPSRRDSFAVDKWREDHPDDVPGELFNEEQNALAWQVFEIAALATQDVDGLERAVTRLGYRWSGFQSTGWSPPSLGSQLDPTQASFLWAEMLRQLATHPKSRSLVLGRSGLTVAEDSRRPAWEHYVDMLACSGHVGIGPGNDSRKMVRVLLDVLEQGEPPYQQIAVNALSSMGPRAASATPQLVRYHCRQDSFLVNVIGGFGNNAGKVSGLDADLSANWKLGGLGPPPEDCLPELLSMLSDPQPGLRVGALHVLSKHAPHTTGFIPQLVELTQDANAVVRVSAARSLARFAEPQLAASAIVRRLEWETPLALDDWASDRGHDHFAYAHLLAALDSLGPEAVSAVPLAVRLVEDRHGRFDGQAAAYLLGHIGPAARQGVACLVATLAEEDRDVSLFHDLYGYTNSDRLHNVAADALAGIGPPAAEAVPALVARLHTGRNYADIPRRAAALDQIDPGWRETPAGREALGRYLAAIERRDHFALVALGTYGDRAATAVKLLIEQPDDPNDSSYAATVTYTLGQIGPSAAAAVPWISRWLGKDGDASFTLRSAAAEALGRIGPDAKPAIPQIAMLLADHNYYALRVAAESALDAIDPDWRNSEEGRHALTLLRRALKQTQPQDSRRFALGEAIKHVYGIEHAKFDFERTRYQLAFETSLGNFVIDLAPEAAPRHVRAILCLAEARFFDGQVMPLVGGGVLMRLGYCEETIDGGPGFALDMENSTLLHAPGVLTVAGSTSDSPGMRLYVALRASPSLDQKSGKSSSDPYFTPCGHAADEASLQVLQKLGQATSGDSPASDTPVTIKSARIVALPK